jgi:diacylglycerol kinase family enzyme
MIEMRALEKKNRFKIRLSSEERLTLALKNLDRMPKNYPEADCQLVLDDEIVAGTFLLLEIANMAFIGPNLQLFPRPDPSDGQLDVVWTTGEQRSQWQEYLQVRRSGQSAALPVNSRRCRRALFIM